MATDIRKSSIADPASQLSREAAALISQELRVMAADLVEQGRRVAVAAGLLGGAGVLGVGSFGAVTSALIAALERRPARGAFLVAVIYGAGAGALAEAGVKRLSGGAPAAAESSGRGVKAAASSAREAAGKATEGKAPAKVVKGESAPSAVAGAKAQMKPVHGKSRARRLAPRKTCCVRLDRLRRLGKPAFITFHCARLSVAIATFANAANAVAARAAGGRYRRRSVAWNAALTSSPLLTADAGARRAGIARRCTTPHRPFRSSDAVLRDARNVAGAGAHWARRCATGEAASARVCRRSRRAWAGG